MPTTFVACAVIVDNMGRYLLIRRARDPFLGEWSCISGIGASRKGLTPDQAIIDEVSYDIGAEFQGQFAFSYPLPESKLANIAHVFIGKVDQNRISLNPEAATEYKWFSRRELEQEPTLAFECKWVLEQVIAK